MGFFSKINNGNECCVFKQISAFKYFSTKNMWPNRDEKSQIETVYGCIYMLFWASACWDHIFTIFNMVFLR